MNEKNESTKETSDYPLEGCARIIQTARFLGVTYPTLWRWVSAGKIPKPFELSKGVKVFDAAEIRAWIKSKKEDS